MILDFRLPILDWGKKAMIKESSMGSASERDPKSSQRYLVFGNEKGIGKIVFRAKAQSMSSESRRGCQVRREKNFLCVLGVLAR